MVADTATYLFNDSVSGKLCQEFYILKSSGYVMLCIQAG
jgi:hypothetical protein